MNVVGAAVLSLAASAGLPAAAQSLEDKIEAVIAGSPILAGICTTPSANKFGWPAVQSRECTYAMTDKVKGKGGKLINKKRKAIVQLLLVEPAVIARWIESACTKVKNPAACVDHVHKRAVGQTHYQFAISGNVLEDLLPKDGVHENYAFRHGITVRISPGFNGSIKDYSISDQIQVMNAVDDKIIGMKSGKARFWSTLPSEFKAHFPSASVPPAVGTAAGAQAWAKLVQTEFLAALKSPDNRLLEAWLCQSNQSAFKGKCK